MMIQNAVLHILDFNAHMCILSQRELDLSSDAAYEYVDNRIRRMVTDDSQQSGIFYASSTCASMVRELAGGQMDFSVFAAQAAQRLYDILLCCDEQRTTDVLTVLFQDDKDRRQAAVLLLDNKTAYTHQIFDDEGAVYNQFIRHCAILPGTTQKTEAYVLICLDDFTVRFSDKKRKLNGEDTYILPEHFLQCTAEISAKDAVKLVEKIAAKVAENYGGNTVSILSKTKNYLAECGDDSQLFSPHELGDAIFSDSPVMKREFSAQVGEAKLPDTVPIRREFARRAGKSHKIKTDTGIEITFPSEYVENTEYIQFINHPDGTISIELKHIGKIINK